MSEILNGLSVTSIIRLKPKAGLKKKELKWFQTFSDEAAKFNGHLGAELFETINKNKEPELAIIIHFDTYEDLMLWENSEQRREQIELSKLFFKEVEPTLRVPGPEYWFETNEVKVRMPPPKWKMLIIMILIIFTFLNTLIPLLRGLFIQMELPAMVNSFLGIVIMVTLMTYLVMPFTNKILSGWLFRQKPSVQGGAS